MGESQAGPAGPYHAGGGRERKLLQHTPDRRCCGLGKLQELAAPPAYLFRCCCCLKEDLALSLSVSFSLSPSVKAVPPGNRLLRRCLHLLVSTHTAGTTPRYVYLNSSHRKSLISRGASCMQDLPTTSPTIIHGTRMPSISGGNNLRASSRQSSLLLGSALSGSQSLFQHPGKGLDWAGSYPQSLAPFSRPIMSEKRRVSYFYQGECFGWRCCYKEGRRC